MTEVKVLNYPEHQPPCSAAKRYVMREQPAMRRLEAGLQLMITGLAATTAAGSERWPSALCMAKGWMQKAPAAKRPKLHREVGRNMGGGSRKTLASEGPLSHRKQSDSFDHLHPIRVTISELIHICSRDYTASI